MKIFTARISIIGICFSLFHHKPLAVSDIDTGTGGGALQGAAGHVVEDGGLFLAERRGVLDGCGRLVDGVVDDKCESLGKIMLVANI